MEKEVKTEKRQRTNRQRSAVSSSSNKMAKSMHKYCAYSEVAVSKSSVSMAKSAWAQSEAL